MSTRWALCLRQSVRRADSDLSIETQRARCRALLPKGAPAVEFVDYESGARSDRAAYQAMLRAIEAGEIAGVAAWEISRLGRKASDLLALIELLEAHGLPLLLANGISVRSADQYRLAKSMLGMSAVMAQGQRDSIRDLNRDKRRQQASQGRWPGGPPPYGYQYLRGENRQGRLQILLPEAGVVAEMFRLFTAEGLTGRQVAGRLIEAGHRTRAGRPWSSSTVLTHLRNPIYTGALVHGRYAVRTDGKQVAQPRDRWSWSEGSHEPLIDRETWERAWEIAASRSGRDRIRRWPPRPFSGIARCGLCGAAVCVQGGGHAAGGGSRPYYVCTLYAKSGKQACAGVRYSGMLLEETLVAAIDDNCRGARDVLAGVAVLKPSSAPVEPPARRIAAVRRRIAREVWLYRQGATSKRQFEGAHARMLAEIAAIEAERPARAPRLPARFGEYWQRATPYQRRLLAGQVLEAVILHPDRIEVSYQPFGLKGWRQQETIPRPRHVGRGGCQRRRVQHA